MWEKAETSTAPAITGLSAETLNEEDGKGAAHVYSDKMDEMEPFIETYTSPTYTDGAPYWTVGAGDDMSVTITGDVTRSVDEDDMVHQSVAGSVDKAPGTFTCMGVQVSACTLNTDGDEIDQGTWQFTPDGGVNAMRVEPDTQYLRFGYWLDKTGPTPTIGLFSEAMGYETSYAAPEVSPDETETATFSGNAAGKYAIVNSNVITPGYFTADADLKATFMPTATESTIEGTISNFDASHLSDLTVMLRTETIDSNGATSDPDPGMGTDWAGQLVNDADGVAAVHGTFSYGDDGRNLAGAFAATKDEDE